MNETPGSPGVVAATMTGVRADLDRVADDLEAAGLVIWRGVPEPAKRPAGKERVRMTLRARREEEE